MADYDLNDDDPPSSAFSLRGFLIHDWPYLVMLVLALFGVAYTNFARQTMTGYWITLAPLYGLICVITRWHASDEAKYHFRLILTQSFHWGAVLFAMYLVFVADVKQMMNEMASSLMVLTVLALGTFTAGVHIAALRVCLVGLVLGIGVPAIAWFEESSLFVALVVLVLLGLVALFFVIGRRRTHKSSSIEPV